MPTFFLMLLTNALFQGSPDLIGVWEGVDPYGVKAVLELKQDGSALFKIGEQLLFAADDTARSPKLIFNLDSGKSPAHFDLVVLDASGNEVRKAKLLLRWESENQISLALGAQLEQRPESFETKNRIHTLQLSRK